MLRLLLAALLLATPAAAEEVTREGAEVRVSLKGQDLCVESAELGIPAAEAAAWAAAFEHLQMLRLHVQLAPAPGGNEPPGNLCRVDDLNELDRRLLRETLRMAARLQQRIELDYRR